MTKRTILIVAFYVVVFLLGLSTVIGLSAVATGILILVGLSSAIRMIQINDQQKYARRGIY